LLLPVLLVAAHGQTSGKAKFELASIKANAPQSGFHFATLIVNAFKLQPYQFPGRTSLTDNTDDILAKIATGATEEEFSAMLQNLLTTDASQPSAADQHRYAQAESHNHSGVIAFGTSAIYRADNQALVDLARVLSDQIGLPIDDEAGIPGNYDISLRWSGTAASHAGNHSGSAGHGSHDGGGGAPSTPAADPSGPTLFDALQQQLGLRLVPAEQSLARLFVIDRVAQRPTEN
jgi:hypothetical protein